ncbi:hypothetical protein I6A84_43020 [Frankia sp. CNm7]|uniref:Uncharacterized protein n=1 Tax=Frankia nepalensis TaxID=1836974 RepID=A0A937UU46_9ACTN|nr:hypothetical protein [Frankia nepalensis]MBL7499545.1 hypothetical protein [Frankia nepalensis]MBL7515624.1 hypothetical protein [Frankia nepalensis]MBL7524637.1 hypothetical protein [Frankia nepalensis]MBL7630721.1 hypothetical protein [Frankia nepalensis]
MSVTSTGGWVPAVDQAAFPAPAPPRPAPPAPPVPAEPDAPAWDLVIVVGAGGGVGRSTIADLVARGLCGAGPVLLVDDTPGLFSSRRTLPRDRDGLAVVPGYDGDYEVLAPEEPMSRIDTLAMVEAAGPSWSSLVIDTYDGVLYLLRSDPWSRLLTAPWARVLLATASATGPLQQAVTAARALRQAGVAQGNLVAAVADISAGRVPRPALARMTLLGAECGAVARVPHLTSVRAAGRLEAGHGGRPAERAATALVRHLALKETT